jgi:hypothetical protein
LELLKYMKKGKRKGSYGRKFEDSVCAALEELTGAFKRSGAVKIPYTDQPALYLPDIIIERVSNIYIEVKSWLDYEDQRKMKNVKRCNPDLDIRFIFRDPNKKLSTSNMTHAEWSEKYHFKWGTVDSLEEWLKEQENR